MTQLMPTRHSRRLDDTKRNALQVLYFFSTSTYKCKKKKLWHGKVCQVDFDLSFCAVNMKHYCYKKVSMSSPMLMLNTKSFVLILSMMLLLIKQEAKTCFCLPAHCYEADLTSRLDTQRHHCGMFVLLNFFCMCVCTCVQSVCIYACSFVLTSAASASPATENVQRKLYAGEYQIFCLHCKHDITLDKARS